ncbi:MAG TPA: hypothetical protein VFM18_18005 [Methanosarcina sp.]|nr:hypothetical protein [Methanosarcina sp.]
MYLNLLDKEDALSFHYGESAKLIQDLRARHLAEGGDPVDFPDYLKQNGVEMVGPMVKISDSFATMAKLKFG